MSTRLTVGIALFTAMFVADSARASAREESDRPTSVPAAIETARSSQLSTPAPVAEAESSSQLPPPAAVAEEGSSSQLPDPAAAVSELGNGLGLEISTGLHGSLSFVEAGVRLPQFLPHMTSALKLTAMSGINWATFSNLDTGETVSVHPVVVGGLVSIGGTSDVVRDFIRVYGGADLLLGTTLTPYDSYFYGRDDLIGPNLTYGVFGNFGIEVFTSEHFATFAEAGGGFKSLKVEKETPHAIAASWLGSGVTLKAGTRFYF